MPCVRTVSRGRLRSRLRGRLQGLLRGRLQDSLHHWLRGADAGSGTVAGVMLILLVAVMLSVVAAAGNLLVCQTRARSAADLAALSAAVALRDGVDDPCGVASTVVFSFAREFAGSGLGSGDAMRLDDCVIDGEDMQVIVAVATQVPFAPHVERSSRAGPVECA
ncbi:flp pilus-assembly TadE/G-like family protein [Bifidobacterium sp. 82T10]|uniref:Flp pilus-assembly TadE/G-like family protein n=2 Tax=Bifidobacterium miconis TaxID=2834435 RepID=A0ABS6WG83_9BIFI|nr:flp pilus-assembly TadE/G-like family protein [Bifidobacterium miconis]